MADIKTVYLLNTLTQLLHPEVNRGRLVYRAKGSAMRISDRLKQGLVKQKRVIELQIPGWLM